MMIGVLSNSAGIQNLWPDMAKDFDLDTFKKEVLSKQSFEEQIEVFHKNFNLFRNYYLCVTKPGNQVLFSIYCGCKSCREKNERYSIEKEQLFNQYRAKLFLNLQKELSDIPDFVERAKRSFKYFGDNSALDEYRPYTDAAEEYVVSTLPKNDIDRKAWNFYIIESFNEKYFYNENDEHYSKSFEYKADQFNKQLRFAIYPQEELNQEVQRVRQEYGRPDVDAKSIDDAKRNSIFKITGIKEFRDLVSGKTFDIFSSSNGLRFSQVRLEQYHVVQYLKYLEDLNNYFKNKGTLPDSIMNNPLPSSYDPIIIRIIRTLAKGYVSKSDYTHIDDQIKNLTQEQAYAFLSRISEGLQHVLSEHIKICQHPANSCTHQQSIERAHNSITNRMLDYAPVEPEPKSIDSNGMLNGLNNSQTVLIVYYILKIFGLEPRKGMDVTQAAKIAHLLTGKELTVIGNSDFYKKFKQVPNFKQDKSLIEDLEIIKPYFIKAQLNEAVKMIDNEIETAKIERTKK